MARVCNFRRTTLQHALAILSLAHSMLLLACNCMLRAKDPISLVSCAEDQWKFIALSAYLFALFMVAAGKDTFEQIKLPPPAAMSGAQPGKESAIDLVCLMFHPLNTSGLPMSVLTDAVILLSVRKGTEL